MMIVDFNVSGQVVSTTSAALPFQVGDQVKIQFVIDPNSTEESSTPGISQRTISETIIRNTVVFEDGLAKLYTVNIPGQPLDEVQLATSDPLPSGVSSRVDFSNPNPSYLPPSVGLDPTKVLPQVANNLHFPATTTSFQIYDADGNPVTIDLREVTSTQHEGPSSTETPEPGTGKTTGETLAGLGVLGYAFRKARGATEAMKSGFRTGAVLAASYFPSYDQ